MAGLNVFLIILAVIGHLVIVRAALAAVYRLGLRQRIWHVAFASLGAIGIGVPILFIAAIVSSDAAVIGAGEWAALHPALLAYAALCVLVVPVAIVVAIHRNAQRPPACQISSRTVIHDATQSLDDVPAPVHFPGRLARLPRNEVFSLEVTERQVRLARLPQELDGLSVLHVTDLHMNGTPDRAHFEWAAEICAAQRADLIALTGDVIDQTQFAEWLPTTLGRLAAPMGRYFVLGNHDLHVGPDAIREALVREGWTWLGGRAVVHEVNGHSIVIAGTERPWVDETPAHDASGSIGLKILLAHSPDEIRWARASGYDLMLAGHLHGGQVRLPLLGPVSGGRLARGLFDLPPTVLHVSRGMGQMMPIRWGCRPEATKLILRARATA